METKSPFDDLMTDAEYNKALGRGPRTSQRQRAERTGPAYIKVGRQIYYRKDAVREWLLANETTPVRSKVLKSKMSI